MTTPLFILWRKKAVTSSGVWHMLFLSAAELHCCSETHQWVMLFSWNTTNVTAVGYFKHNRSYNSLIPPNTHRICMVGDHNSHESILLCDIAELCLFVSFAASSKIVRSKKKTRHQRKKQNPPIKSREKCWNGVLAPPTNSHILLGLYL